MLKIFRHSIFFCNTKGFLDEFFRYCETKIWQKNCDKSLFSHQKICETRNFVKHRSVSTRNFSALWNRKVSTDNSEVPLLSLRFFDTRFFLKHRTVALRIFSVMWDTDFDQKLWYTPLFLIQNYFRYPKFSETQKGSPTNFLGFVRQKFWQKIVIQNPLLLSKIFFDTRSVLNHRRVPPRNFWTLWDKKLIAVTNDIPFLRVNFFHTQFLMNYRRVPPRFFLVLWDENFDKNLRNDTSSLIH